MAVMQMVLLKGFFVQWKPRWSSKNRTDIINGVHKDMGITWEEDKELALAVDKAGWHQHVAPTSMQDELRSKVRY